MTTKPIICGNIAADLRAAPINPDWIRKGNPVARNATLSYSEDRAACTLLWDCTPGEFEWRYDIDETIHVLEGSIVLNDGASPPRRLGPGDIVFFPAGAVVHWTVEAHVRKLAFFRRPMPFPLALFYRALSKAKSVIKGRVPVAAPVPSAS